MPPRTSSRFFHALAEAAVLAAVLAVPLFFVVPTEQVFEPAKAALLRTLGAVAAVGWFGSRTWSEGHPSPGRRGRLSLPRNRLVLAALCIWAVEALATLTSVAPWTSLMGSYVRGQGLYTTSSLLALMLAASEVARRPAGRARLATFLGVSLFAPSLYAVVQRFGLDPLPWEGDVVTRVAGPAGASVMLAAHVAMMLPFALYAAAGAWRATAASSGAAADPTTQMGASRDPQWGPSLRLALWLVIVGMGVGALLLSGSRGPLLGLVAGLGIAALAWAAQRGRWRLALAVTALGIGLVGFVIALNVARARETQPGADGQLQVPTTPSSPLAALTRLPVLDRLSVGLNPERSTTRVRMRLWEGSAEAITTTLTSADPVRILLGYGPETMDRIWAPFYPPILAYDEPRGVVPDRAHNLFFDTFLNTGILGVLAMLALFGMALNGCLRTIGLGRPVSIRTASERTSGALAKAWSGWSARSWIGFVVVGAGLAKTLALVLDAGRLRLVGPVAGLGVLAGLAVGLAWQAWRRRGMEQGRAGLPPGAPSPELVSDEGRYDSGMTEVATRLDDWLPFAILAALIAHWVDVQVSFGVTATRLGFWLLLALLVVREAGSDSALDGREGEPLGSPDRSPLASHWTGSLAALVVGFTMIYDFTHFGLVAGGAVAAAVLTAIGAGVTGWAVALDARIESAADPEPHAEAESDGGGGKGQGRPFSMDSWERHPALATLAILAAFAAVNVALRYAGRTSASEAVPSVVVTLAWYAVAMAAVIVAWARRGGESWRGGRARALVAVGVAGAILLAAISNGVGLAADALLKEGSRGWQEQVQSLRTKGELGRAESFLDRARDRYALAAWLAPWEPSDRLALAREAVERADLLDERLSRTLAQAGMDKAADEYAEDLLGGTALKLANERDAAFERGLAQIDRAEALARPGGAGPSPALHRARSMRLWGDRTREPARRKERLTAARDAYARVLANIAPRWPEVMDEAAVAAIMDQDPRAALDLTSRAVAIDEYYVRAWRTAASAHALLDELEAAADDYTQYFKDYRNASDLPALRAQLEVLVQLKRTGEALQLAQTIARTAPGDPHAQADLAVLLDQTGDRTAALEAARRAAELAPEDAGIAALVQRLAGGGER